MLELKKYTALYPIYAIIFIGYFGYALIMALFIPMIMDPSSSQLLSASATIGYRAAISGALIAMYPLGQFLGSPIIGVFSDHFGRKKILTISLMYAFAGYCFIGLAIYSHHLLLLFISCFLTGLCESNMAVAQSVVADITNNPAERGRFIGYMYSACSLGFISGPLLGGFVVVTMGYAAPFFITAIGMLVILYALTRYFSEQRQVVTKGALHYLKAFSNFFTIFTDKSIRRLYCINFLIFFSIMSLYRVVPMYMVGTWQTPVHMITLMVSYVSFICMLANLFLVSPLAKRLALPRLLIYLTSIAGVSVLVMLLPNGFNWLWLTYGFSMVPTALALSIATAWLSNSVDESRQGRVLGNNQALFVLAEGTSALVGGLLAAITVILPLIISGVLLLLLALLLLFQKIR